MYFLLEAVKHSLAVLVLVEDNLHFQGVLIYTFHHTQVSVGQDGAELGPLCGFFSEEPFVMATAEQNPQSCL